MVVDYQVVEYWLVLLVVGRGNDRCHDEVKVVMASRVGRKKLAIQLPAKEIVSRRNLIIKISDYYDH